MSLLSDEYFFLFLSVLKCIPHEYVKNVANEHILAAFSRKHTQTTSKEKKLDALTLTHTYHKNTMKWQSKVKPTKSMAFIEIFSLLFLLWKNEKKANAACNIHSLFRTFQANENSKRKKSSNANMHICSAMTLPSTFIPSLFARFYSNKMAFKDGTNSFCSLWLVK